MYQLLLPIYNVPIITSHLQVKNRQYPKNLERKNRKKSLLCTGNVKSLGLKRALWERKLVCEVKKKIFSLKELQVSFRTKRPASPVVHLLFAAGSCMSYLWRAWL